MRKLSVLLCILLLGASAKKPYLKLTAFPMNQMSQMGRPSRVTVWARLLPPEVESEDYYCPGVRWIAFPDTPDKLEAFEESDCPPFDKRDEYPRVWKREYFLGGEGDYPIQVKLEKPKGNVLLNQQIVVSVR